MFSPRFDKLTTIVCNPWPTSYLDLLSCSVTHLSISNDIEFSRKTIRVGSGGVYPSCVMTLICSLSNYFCVKYLPVDIRSIINFCCIIVVNWFLIMFKCQLCSVCLSESSLEANTGIINSLCGRRNVVHRCWNGRSLLPFHQACLAYNFSTYPVVIS